MTLLAGRRPTTTMWDEPPSLLPPPEVTDTLTPRHAFRRGYRLLVLGPMLVTIGGLVAMAVAASLARAAGIAVPGWTGAATVPAALGAGWLWWGVAAPRWRLWAMRNCGDWPRVHRAAAASLLIWPDGHLVERTEITTARQRQERRDLQQAWQRAVPR